MWFNSVIFHFTKSENHQKLEWTSHTFEIISFLDITKYHRSWNQTISAFKTKGTRMIEHPTLTLHIKFKGNRTIICWAIYYKVCVKLFKKLKLGVFWRLTRGWEIKYPKTLPWFKTIQFCGHLLVAIFCCHLMVVIFWW